MIERIIRGCLEHRILTLLVVAGICAAGAVALAIMPIDAIPDLSDVQVIIVTEWEGQNPRVIEDQVTYPISTAMLNVASVRDVRAQSYFGVSFVYVIFDDGTDIYWARSRVQEYLSGIQLPQGPQVRIGPDASGLGWVYMYTLEDTERKYDLGELRALQDWYVANVLRGVEGVAEVASVGGARRRYEVIADPERMLAYRVSVPDLATAIRTANRDVGGMSVEIAEHDFMVRGRGYIRAAKDIEDIVVRAQEGTPVRVRDVADVVIGPSPERGIAERNGTGEVVAGIVVVRQGANARDLIARVKATMEKEVKPGLPAGVVVREAYDRTPLISRAVATLTEATLQAFLIIFLVCFVFLLHARSAIVAFITLPTGALATFIVMWALGIPTNIMTIAGITIAFGAMVDASICMVDNAHRHIARGVDRHKAVYDACMEVGPGLFTSLLVATITNLPLFALEDQEGRMFKPLAWTNMIAEGAACVLSVTLIPPLVYYFVRGRIIPEEANPVSRLMLRLYGPVVQWSLRSRWLVSGAAAVITLFALAPWWHLGREFMPPLEEGDLLYMPTTVPGLGIGEARRALQTQDAVLATFPEVKNVLGKIGRSTSATDPAPLDMVETTTMLHDETSWPARSLPKGWVEARARRALENLKLDAAIAPAVEGMTRAEINDSIRRQLQLATQRERAGLSESYFEEIRFSLQAQILRATEPAIARELDDVLTRDILSMLTAKGQVPAGERPSIEQRVRDWLTAHPPGRVPLRPLTFEELTREEMARAIKQPGMPNWFLMPIVTRIGMITTGMRGYLGLKVFGTDFERVEKLAIDLERLLNAEVPNTVSAVAERPATGGYYLDVVIDRIACARYGISVEEVQMVVETAIGGMAVTQTVEGRYRFAVAVRYPRERRDDPEQLKRILVRLPGAAGAAMDGMASAGVALPDVVTLGQLAAFEMTRGPMVIKSDNNMLVVYLPIQFEAVSLGEYVARAQQVIDGAIRDARLEVPSGYTMKWSGQYEMMEKANRRLLIIVPLTVLLTLLILYLHFRRMAQTLIIMGTLLFAAVGAVWLTYLLDYNISTAWWLGFLLLLGVAGETGVIMLVYLENAYNDFEKRYGRMTRSLLDRAIAEGATRRVRPKVMTVAVDIFGLAPMLWAVGAGAATLQRMAAPLVGGMITSLLLTLVVIPAVYRIVRGWKLPEGDENAVAVQGQPVKIPPSALP